MHWKYYIIPRIIRLIKSVFSDLVLVGSQEILKWIWVFFFFWVLSVLFVSFKYAATDFLLVFIYSNLEIGLILFFVGFFFLEKKNLMACMTCIIEQIL
jgi:hypothetical protein